MKHTYLILSLSFILAGFACKETPTEGGSPFIRLTAEDIGVTDAYVRLGALIPGEVREVRLLRGETVIFQANALPADTVLLVDSLLPNHAYTLTAELRTTGDFYHTSSPLTFTTMDTTSHNFTWQIDTLGDGGGSVLYDVAIINDTLAYAVGEINVKDSLGNWQRPPYNVARWDGRKWELMTALTKEPTYGYGELYSVFAFSPNDVWVGGSIPIRWDGSTWIFHGSTRGYQGGFRIRKIWGTSSQDLYCVGDGGNIRYYDGRTWRKLESGTTLPIKDIWGSVESRTSKPFILAVSSYSFSAGERSILHITEQNFVDTLPWVQGRRAHSIWFNTPSRLYACGDFIWSRNATRVWRELVGGSVIPYFTRRVRGSTINDIFVVGDFGVVTHFNGVDWKLYPQVSVADIYYSVAYNGRLMVAVGFIGSRAVVLRMRR